MKDISYEEGSACPSDGCSGTLDLAEVIGCSCHIAPPCSSCVDAGYACKACGWDSNPDRYSCYEEIQLERESQLKARPNPPDRYNETTTTYTCSPFNSTPFTRCCGVAAIREDRCPTCRARITSHDDGLAARRREVGPGNCLMCGKRRGPIGISGNCCC